MHSQSLPTSFNIRSATEEDASPLAALRASVISESPFLLETASEVKNDPELMKRQIQRLSDNGYFLVADLGSQLIGMLTFGRSEFLKIKHRGGLMTIVHKGYRRSGIGRSLLNAFLEAARKDPTLERLDISVMSENTSAIRLYEGLGFNVEGRRTRAYKFPDGSHQDEIYMGLLLHRR